MQTQIDYVRWVTYFSTQITVENIRQHILCFLLRKKLKPKFNARTEQSYQRQNIVLYIWLFSWRSMHVTFIYVLNGVLLKWHSHLCPLHLAFRCTICMHICMAIGLWTYFGLSRIGRLQMKVVTWLHVWLNVNVCNSVLVWICPMWTWFYWYYFVPKTHSNHPS